MKVLLFNFSFFLSFSLFSINSSFALQKNKNAETTQTLNIGFFPNLTHPQALVAQALTRKGKDWFKNYLPENICIKWHRFNAGPSAMESLCTGAIDLSYVGPSPAINLYTRTDGNNVRLLSGAVKGGSGLVLQNNISIKEPKDLNYRKIATPQFGNTQDIACRAWFAEQSINGTKLLPTSNPDQLLLFKRKQIDGAWTIEPWLSRLINEGNGKLFFSDDTNWTTLLVGSHAFCEKHPTLKPLIIKAHKELSIWIKNNLKEAACLIQEELLQQTRLKFSTKLIENTLSHLQLEVQVKTDEIQKWLKNAIDINFIKKEKQISLDKFFSEILSKNQENTPQISQTVPLKNSKTN